MGDTGKHSKYKPSYKWDNEQILDMRSNYQQVCNDRDDINSTNMFGPKDSWPLINHNCGTATGWGGLPKEQAVYLDIPVDDDSGVGRFKFILRDVPIRAF